MKKNLTFVLTVCIIISAFIGCDVKEDTLSKNKETSAESILDTFPETVAENETQAPTVTEAPTVSETEGPGGDSNETEPQTEPETESQTDRESETEPKTTVSFEKYTVKGEGSDAFTAAAAETGLPAPSAGTGRDIFVGEHYSALTQKAKELITRPNSYHDFAILNDGDDLAIWGGSEEAISRAIAYLVENYAKGGFIEVPNGFRYTDMPEITKSVTIDGKTLDAFTVITNSSINSIAQTLARELSWLSGYRVECAPTAEQCSIVLKTTGTTTDLASSYTVSYSENKLTVSAENKGTLVLAVSALVKELLNGLEITEGYSNNLDLPVKTALATNTELFKYCGTWQATDENNPTSMISYWDAAYVEIDFTGNSITLMFSSPSTFKYRIDGGSYIAVNDAIGDITVSADGDGTHTIRILQDDKAMHIYFAGVKLPESEMLSRTPDKKHYIQFVGDSISDDSRSFAHRSPELLDWDYSTIACQAISLVRNKGSWKVLNGYSNGAYTEGSMAWHFNKNFGITSVGMEDAFFKLGIPHQNFPAQDSNEFKDIAENYFTEKYDFNFATGYTPDIVFIFLGTNDLGFATNETSMKAFNEAYKAFVAKIFEKYGTDTQIVIMQAVSTSKTDDLYNTDCGRYNGIRQTAADLMALYPNNVSFLGESELLSWNVEISSDGTHPSGYGYSTLSTKIAEWLKSKFD